jgi:hypothetical protein
METAMWTERTLAALATGVFAGVCSVSEAADKYAIVRCGRDITQAEYSGYPMKCEVRQIFHVDKTYTWLRECLLQRMPDGSLCCVFFTGGKFDGDINNMVAAIRSDDDGKTWSGVEVIRQRKGAGCWAPSMFVYKNRAYLFWCTKSKGWNDMTNRILVTEPGGRTFTEDRVILQDWLEEGVADIRHGTIPRNGRVPLPIKWGAVDIRHGTILRNGRVLLPIKWEEKGVLYVGVMEPNSDFTSFTRYGRVHKPTPEGPTKCVPLFENAIAELSGGRLAMLIRGDVNSHRRAGYLWRSDSNDGGKTWSDPYLTDIPNPGTKPRIINLPDGRIVLFHNPNKKDYADPNVHKNHHRHRTRLEMWVSADDMKSWYLKRTIVSAPKVAQYPDGFYDADRKAIYLCWEDDRTIYFQRILLEELS